jgi:Zn-dependent peptidase ImmA (M78 family)
VPVEAIAADLLGLHVEEVEDLPVSGCLLPARRTIRLHAGEVRESAGRGRFTLAHEIAHWVCHCSPGSPSPPMLCRPSAVTAGGDPLEREANTFAAELIMPADAVASTIARDAGLSTMAEELGVSDIALAWRLYNLGLAAAPPI